MLSDYSQTGQVSSRTNDRFTIVVDFECTFSVTDDERKIEEVLHGLRKIVWIYDKFEQVDGASGFKNFFNLRVVSAI